MDIELKKWGNSIGLRIPLKIAQSLGIEENSVVELTLAKEALVITKKKHTVTLDEILASIPDEFEYPVDVQDFVESVPLGQEMI